MTDEQILIAKIEERLKGVIQRVEKTEKQNTYIIFTVLGIIITLAGRILSVGLP